MKKLLIWTFVLGIFFTTANTAFAKKILFIKNNSQYTINLALRYHDYEYNDWVTLGWVVVKAGESQKLSIDTNNSALYFYGRTNNKKYFWGGSYNDKNDRKYWVRDAQMLIRGQGRITGKNQRRVWFDHLSAGGDGNFHINLR